MRHIKKRVIGSKNFCLVLAILLISSALLPMANHTPVKASASLGHKLTNVNDVRFTISWVTTDAEKGYVEYGDTPALGNIAYDNRGQEVIDNTHHVTVFGTIKPDTRYYYDIVSGSKKDDNGGKHYTVTTGPTLEIPRPDDIIGQVFLDEAKTTPGGGAIVYITVVANGAASQELSALVEQSGWWGVDIGSIRAANYQNYFNYTENDEVLLLADGASKGHDSKSCSIAVAKAGAPAMVLTSEPVPGTPSVLYALPANGATDIDTNVNITVIFSQNMNQSTINANSFTIESDSTPAVGVVTYDDRTKTANFDPTADLDYSTTYTAIITTEAKSKDGHSLSQSYTWSFTTIAAQNSKEPPPTPAPAPTGMFDIINCDGVFLKAITTESEDGKVELGIDKDTAGLIEGKPISGVSITKLKREDVPQLPEGYTIIGSAYDFRPSQATFKPSISLTISYDIKQIPSGISEENLVIAFYDSSEWVMLEGCDIDPATNTIESKVAHFTVFAVMAYAGPAAVTLSAMAITPAEVGIGQKAMVSLTVNNNGGLEVTRKILLRIDDTVTDVAEVTLAGGSSQKVTFPISNDVPGIHTVSVDKWSGTFSVKAATGSTPDEMISWWVWLIIGIVIVVVVTAIFLVRWSRLLGG